MKRICVCTPSVYAASAAAATTALQIKAHHSGKKPVSLLIVRLSFTRKKHIARLSQGKTFHFNSRPFSFSFSISFSLSILFFCNLYLYFHIWSYRGLFLFIFVLFNNKILQESFSLQRELNSGLLSRR